MANSKVVLGDEVLIDLTADTVKSQYLKKGYTAHGADGELVTGEMEFKVLYTGQGEPASNLGNNGDYYIQLEE